MEHYPVPQGTNKTSLPQAKGILYYLAEIAFRKRKKTTFFFPPMKFLIPIINQVVKNIKQRSLGISLVKLVFAQITRTREQSLLLLTALQMMTSWTEKDVRRPSIRIQYNLREYNLEKEKYKGQSLHRSNE